MSASAAGARPSQGRVLPTWDVFCRVIDNHGDLGVCWRLASDLGTRGHAVRLWCDDASALAWMAPNGHPAVQVLPWRDPLQDEDPGTVVVEAFGCDPPEGFLARMAAQPCPPVWINLEYLSAEPYVERSHGLPSPQGSGPARGLTKWFFYPGFTARTGGLLREPDLMVQRESACSAMPACEPDVLTASLFCYEPPALPSLLGALSALPGRDVDTSLPRQVRLKVTSGRAAQAVSKWLGLGNAPAPSARLTVGTLDLEFLPYLDQPGFDRLLWQCDLNLVRGEDSLVRAIWAERPFLWQLYPQHDDAHHAKLDAFLHTYLDGAGASFRDELERCWRDWNANRPDSTLDLWHGLLRQLHGAWSEAAAAAAHRMATQPDLTTSLIAFALERARP